MALENYTPVLSPKQLGPETQAKIKEFFQPRLKNILTDEGHRYDVIDAVLAVDYNYPTVTMARAKALSEMKTNPQFQALLTAFTRALNLAKKAEAPVIQPEFFVDEAEKALYQALQGVSAQVKAAEAQGNYQEIITQLSTLAQPITKFFEAVMVMAEDEKVRQNRLGLLVQIVELTRTVGDLSKVIV